MKSTRTLAALLSAAACALAIIPSSAFAQQRTLSQDTAAQKPPAVPSPAAAAASASASPIAPTAAPEVSSIQSAIQNGKVSLDMRLRYEFVDQSNLAHDASALTLRTRLGYTTAAWRGFDAGLEAENVVELVDDYSNTLDAKPGYPAVMDPEVTEVNQAWIRHTSKREFGSAQITAGRQRIVLDNTRFVGDVGWRQDNQTFDAIRLQAGGAKTGTTLNYAWLWRANRVQGDRRDWDSDSHIINASSPIGKNHTLALYAHVLAFNGPAPAAAASSKTFGAFLTGAFPLNDAKTLKLAYRAEYASQSDHRNNPADYRADYYLGELGLAHAKVGGAFGYEVLGSDNGQGFRTPLATLHAFNGWSDWALPLANNLPNGLRDAYVKVNATLPGNVQLLAFYHKFEADSGGASYGDEIDIQAGYRLNKNIGFLAKAAFFSGKNGIPDITKFWLQTEYSF